MHVIEASSFEAGRRGGALPGSRLRAEQAWGVSSSGWSLSLSAASDVLSTQRPRWWLVLRFV